MSRTYSPLAVANEFILRSASGIDHMKLQKLVYYAQGYALAEGFRLTNEQPQVWPYGPVFKSLYFDLKYHGEDPIYRPEGDDTYGKPPFVNPGDVEHSKVIKRVWQIFRTYTGIQLSMFTHENGTPWSDIVRRFRDNVPKNYPISEKAMEAYFRKHNR